MVNRLLFIWLILLSGCTVSQSPDDLRVEGMSQPLGIDTNVPHFSWKMPSEQRFLQTAYELEIATTQALLESNKADVWKSGKVETVESVMVSYEGQQLSPRQVYYWRVRTYAGWCKSSWSSPQRFSVGIIAPDAMRGAYIGLGLGQEKALLLKKDFEVQEILGTVLLHVNSLGYHEAYLNGLKVSDAVLMPAVSQLDKRSQVVTYDITSLLRQGSNTLVFSIGSGWYKQDTFHAGYPEALVRADVDMCDGSQIIPLAETDASWTGTWSGYEDTGSWLPGRFGGERIDARVVPADLSSSSLSSLSWNEVNTVVIDTIVATPQMCQPTVIKQTLSPVQINKVGDDQWLVDMGRVVNGFFQIHLPSLPVGTEVKATYTDHLQADGSLPQEIYGEDVFITSGKAEGDDFCNRFNHHLFRYVWLSGLPVEPDINAVKAHRVGMDVATTGTFISSDDDLNRIHNLIHTTMEGLMWGGYMVDCASIERLGYGGDGNASTLSLQNQFDVAPLYINWLQAWNDAIRPDGGLPHTAPNPYKAGGGPYWCSFIVQAPWRTWWNFGDERLLHRCYDNMKLWLRYVDANSQDGLLHRWPDTDYRNWYLGDWLAPRGVDVTLPESVDLVNNCALSQCYAELGQMAEHLGYMADKQEFEQRRMALNQRINEVYFHPETHTYGSGSQLDLAYPLLIQAVPEEHVEAVSNQLMLISDHLQVGLVGIPVLTEWATLNRQADFFYRLLKQHDYPGYLYMLEQGATGTWEDWDNPRSHFHNCFNGIDSWFFQALGGIIPTAPGYRSVNISPQTPEGLDWVTVTRETPYGTILVSWKRQDNQVVIHVEIPNGITANLNGSILTVGSYDCTL